RPSTAVVYALTLASSRTAGQTAPPPLPPPSLGGLRIGAPVAGFDPGRHEPRGVPHEQERRGIAYELYDRDPAPQGAGGRRHRAPSDGHRIAPLRCQAVRSASIRRTASVTAWTLIVAPEILRISFPTRSESPATCPRNCLRHGS